MLKKQRHACAIIQSRFRIVLAISLSMIISMAGCTGSPVENGNAGANSNTAPAESANLNVNTNGNTNTEAAGGAPAEPPLTAREPESYSVEMTVAGQATGNNRELKSPPIQFNFSKSGTDRRWAFKALPGLGEVIYLEKSGAKYFIFPAQKRYAEVQSGDADAPLANLLTPTAAIEQMRSRGQFERLGDEVVNDRQAVKYRLNKSANTNTQAGTAEAESIIYVDQETGLPLRADMNLSNSGGQTIRVMTETRNIQLNPDPSIFNEPTGMKKVTTQELQQQMQAFAVLLRLAAAMLGQPAGGQL